MYCIDVCFYFEGNTDKGKKFEKTLLEKIGEYVVDHGGREGLSGVKDETLNVKLRADELGELLAVSVKMRKLKKKQYIDIMNIIMQTYSTEA